MHFPSLFVRGSYYLTITGAPLFTVAHAVFWLRNSSAEGAVLPSVIAAVYCLAASLAWLRVKSGAGSIPTAAVSAAPIIATLVAGASLAGTLAMLVTLQVLFDPRLAERDVGGPLALFIFLTLGLYGFALLTAEWVLVGSDSSRGNGRDPSAPL